MKSRICALTLAIGFACIPIAARAQSELMLGVSEGSSGGLDHARVIAKYGGLADLMSRTLKRKVLVVLAREFSLLEGGIKSGRFDLVFARPSDYPARAVRDHGYQFVASAKPDGQCFVVVPEDSPVNTLAEAKGQRWVMPEQVSYMAKLCTAELRERGMTLSKENVQTVREQAAVPFYLDNKFADVGLIASYSSPAKNLDRSGYRVVHKSVMQPYFPLVAGPKITQEQVRALQAQLSTLQESEAGRDVLRTVGVEGFDVTSGQRLRAMLTWLGV